MEKRTTTVSPETFRTIRDRTAADTFGRSFDRHHRMLAVASGSIRTDGGAALPLSPALALALASDEAIRSIHACVDSVGSAAEGSKRGAALASKRVGEASGMAFRAALEPSQNGPIRAASMRVRPAKGGSAPEASGTGAPRPAVDTGAARIEAARNEAIRTLKEAIRGFNESAGLVARGIPCAARKAAAHGRIRAILHTWEGDVSVTAAARELGWRI